MEIIIFCLYLFGLFMLVLRSKFFTVEGVKKPLLFFFWILKLIAGVCFYLIFTYSTTYKDASYSRDFFKSSEKLYWLSTREPALFMDFMLGKGSNSNAYRAEAERISSKWYQGSENRIVNDNRTVIRVNTLLQFISFRFYSVHILFMCFLSFVGSVLLFKAFPKQGKKQIYAATVACFLVPSLLFWSVGVLKEPLLVLGLGGFLFYFRRIKSEFSPAILFMLLLSGFLLLCVKIYVFAIVLPMLLVFFWCQRRPRGIVFKYLASVVFLSVGCVLLHVYFPGKKADVIHCISVQNQHVCNPPSPAVCPSPHLDGSMEAFAKNMPLAAYNCITKPFVRPVNNLVRVCINMETILLALLLAVCLLFGNYRRFCRNNFALFCTVVSIYGFILIGLTTHDIGMLMRYRSIFLPFYALGLIHLLDTDRVLRVFRLRKHRKDKNYDPIRNFEERMEQMARR